MGYSSVEDFHAGETISCHNQRKAKESLTSTNCCGKSFLTFAYECETSSWQLTCLEFEPPCCLCWQTQQKHNTTKLLCCTENINFLKLTKKNCRLDKTDTQHIKVKTDRIFYSVDGCQTVVEKHGTLIGCHSDWIVVFTQDFGLWPLRRQTRYSTFSLRYLRQFHIRSESEKSISSCSKTFFFMSAASSTKSIAYIYIYTIGNLESFTVFHDLCT